MEKEFNFKLTTKEMELLLNALQNQTTNLINKVREQFGEQQSFGKEEDGIDNSEIN